MQAQVKLGRIAGISIGLHYSWFIIALLIVLSLAAHFHTANPSWSDVIVWSAAIVTGVMFFAALLLHELAHSILAKARGMKVREITLFALGGVSQIESEAPDAKTEFWIAIAGPITSVAIGIVLIAGARLAGWRIGTEPGTPATAVLVWLGYINIALAAFNMVPGYPLDGGRVLRAVIWWMTRNADRATRLASKIGQTVAFAIILLGLFQFFTEHGNFGGLWLAFIGWFLLDAARTSYVQVSLMTELRGRTVADIMDRNCPTVEAYLSLQDFVDEFLLRSGLRGYVVVHNDQIVGLITPHEVKEVPRDRWSQTSVQAVMRPLAKVHTVSPETPALQALQVMGQEDINQLPVVSDGHLVGLFSRSHVVHFLQAHAQLQNH
ncbi:MAG TPA: site-2 protease family protein [Terriglobales bacterium]|nr:site-2 protease family protein [Terriglobales bacterium]